MARIVDGVVETTQTTGTGTLDLDGAQTGYRAFSDALTSGEETYYCIEDDPQNPTVYEEGIGTWTSGSPATLSRDTVLNSSSGGSKISLQAGTTYTVTGILSVRALQDASFALLTGVAGTNTITASAKPTLQGYKTGQKFRFVAAGANTGAATLNIDSLGAKNLYKPGASGPTALTGGEIQTGQVVEAVYDGTQMNIVSPLAGAPTPATQSDQETGTSTTTFVSPGRQHFHSSAVKQWALFNGTGTAAITKDYGVTSLTDNGTGDYTLTLDSAYDSGNDFACVAQSQQGALANKRSFDAYVLSVGGTALRLGTLNDSGAAEDHARVEVHVAGDIA